MSFTARVIVGLVAGLAVGMGVAAAGPGWWQHLPAVVEPFGLIFVNAIRMTVIPLVASGLIVGVASMRNAGAVSRLGARALLVFVALVAAATLFGAAFAYPLLQRLSLDPSVAANLRAGAAGTGQTVVESDEPGCTTWYLPQWMPSLLVV